MTAGLKIQREQKAVIEREGFENVTFSPGGKHWNATAYYKGKSCTFRLSMTPSSPRWVQHLRNDCRRHKREIDGLLGDKPRPLPPCDQPEINPPEHSPWATGKHDQWVEPKAAPAPAAIDAIAVLDAPLPETSADIEAAMFEKARTGPAAPAQPQRQATEVPTVGDEGRKKRFVLPDRDKVRLAIWMNTQYDIVEHDSENNPKTCKPKGGAKEQDIYAKAIAEGYIPADGYAYHSYQIYRSKLFGALHVDCVERGGDRAGKVGGGGDADAALQICADLEARVGKIEAAVTRIEKALQPIIGAGE